ncbi:general odorant-binding protein 19d [Halyomorpha halys]|uniref:general odorant-binding protein 19d n=1 Tax=Halyomorpha halys TaxID=286706 RepID=UPI0006D4DC86|nr:general odorant-binding protein 19d-like [Halyomorpha halys]
MKFFEIISLTVIVIAVSLSLSGCHEDIVVSIKKVAISRCTEKHPIRKETVRSIMNNEHVPDDHEVKCWLSCIMKVLGMLKDGKINWEHSKNITKYGFSEENKAKVDKITEICQAEVSQGENDECQLAYSAAVCKMNNWKELGLPKGNWE